MFENLRRNAAEVHVFCQALGRQQRGVVNIAAVGLQLPQVGIGPEHEHAAVPVVAAFVQQTLGGSFIRFFDELLHRPGRARIVGGAGGGDVTITGFRAIRRSAEQHQGTFLGDFNALGNGIVERLGFADVVVSRQYQHDAGRIPASDLDRRHGNGRRGITPERLQQHGLRCLADGIKLFFYDKPVFLVGNHHRCLHLVLGQAGQGLLKHAVSGQQR